MIHRSLDDLISEPALHWQYESQRPSGEKRGK